MPDETSDNLISLNNVSYCVDNKTLLNDVSVHTNAKRIGVVGRNGSGKSTLARVLCGLTEVSSGSVRINQVDVARDRKRAINTVGMLFQNPDHQVIFPTVEEELAFGLQQQGSSQQNVHDDVKQILEKFNVSHWLEKSINTLSQGQRHLVCLMAVLLMRPKLIILDEPYAGLDIPTISQLNRFLEDVDATIVHITHQVELIKNYEMVWWMDEGHLIASDKPNVVLPLFLEKMTALGKQNVVF